MNSMPSSTSWTHWIGDLLEATSSFALFLPMVFAIRFFWRQIPFVLFLMSILGLAVRLTVKDSLLATAPIYYATPPGIIGGFALLASLLWFWQGKRRSRPRPLRNGNRLPFLAFYCKLAATYVVARTRQHPHLCFGIRRMAAWVSRESHMTFENSTPM